MRKLGRMKKLCCTTLILGMMLPQVIGSGSAAWAASGTWKHNAKGWWYSYSDGSYAKNTWEKIDGKWYYFDANGYMVTGWKQIGKYWYFFQNNGVIATGWKKIGGKWYYFNSGGVMATGWKQISRNWYFFANGVMVTGWKKISGNWYFFANGAMVTGARTINGKGYIFGANGVWLDLTTLKAGDVITLGEYEQDNNLSNGQEPIEWIVLDKMKDGKLLVVSKYILDRQQYNDEAADVTWETCTVRAWLNSTFLNSAFTTVEQSLIPKTTIKNDDNPERGTEGGNDTKDQVFFLSYDDVNKYYTEDYWYDIEEHPENLYYSFDRACKSTAYAKALGIWTYTWDEWDELYGDYPSYFSHFAGCGRWWLRTPGRKPYRALMVDQYGGLNEDDGYTNNVEYYYGVRPAMYIQP